MTLKMIASSNLSISILIPNSWLYVWKTAKKFNYLIDQTLFEGEM